MEAICKNWFRSKENTPKLPSMKVTETNLKNCFVLEPKIFSDERGEFFESYNQKLFEEKTGLKLNFVQDNQSVSSYGVLRGLHFQTGEHAQAKLVRVAKGKVLDVVVDLRKESPTCGHYFKTIVSRENKKSIFIPKGMAHGFLTLSPEAIFVYKCDAYYNSASEAGIRYNDEDLNIDWGFDDKIILSQKDRLLPTFKELFP